LFQLKPLHNLADAGKEVSLTTEDDFPSDKLSKYNIYVKIIFCIKKVRLMKYAALPVSYF